MASARTECGARLEGLPPESRRRERSAILRAHRETCPGCVRLAAERAADLAAQPAPPTLAEARRCAQATLRALGYRRTTTSASGSSYYAHSAHPLRVRVSDHALPDSATRAHAATFGPREEHILLVSRDRVRSLNAIVCEIRERCGVDDD